MATERYLCTACGAQLRYHEDPSVLVVKCTYCGVEQPAPDVQNRREEMDRKAREDADRQERERENQERQRDRDQEQRDRDDERRDRRLNRRLTTIPTLLGIAAAALGVGFPVWRFVVKPLMAQRWDGKSTFECDGNDDMKISDVTADLGDGLAVRAGGNCQLTIENCHLKAATVVSAGGNARVKLIGGTLEGSELAIEVDGNASVTSNGAQVSGKVLRKGGNATVHGLPKPATDDAATPSGRRRR